MLYITVRLLKSVYFFAVFSLGSNRIRQTFGRTNWIKQRVSRPGVDLMCSRKIAPVATVGTTLGSLSDALKLQVSGELKLERFFSVKNSSGRTNVCPSVGSVSLVVTCGILGTYCRCRPRE